jgi:beta-glucosidase
MVRALLTASMALSTSALVQGPWSDVSLTPEKRARLLVANLTLEEKLVLFHGCKNQDDCTYTGNVLGNSRLDIPPIHMEDGPQGFRDKDYLASSTSWPAGLNMAAIWDVDAMQAWGEGMGKEFKAKGANVQLGPGLCVARVPRNGRNFEYLSGEDPFLGRRLVKPVIEGIQSQKVVANAKHFILNNQETNRHTVSVDIDERVRFEMYYPPFEGAVEAKVGSVMCSYNKIGGLWSCENPTVLRELKHQLGFKGYVMSDWGATHSTSLMQGLDMEMPKDKFMNPEMIQAGLSAGNITTHAIDDAATRIFWSMFSVGVMDVPTSTWSVAKKAKNVTTDESVVVARQLASASTVLLKNQDGVLPLPSGKKLAVLGFGDAGAVVHAGGSGHVVPSYISKPLDAITRAAGEGATVAFNNGTDIDAAAQLARSSDYAIVFVATLSSEGKDRVSLSLDDGCEVNEKEYGDQCKGNAKQQNVLVAAIAAANAKTIVVASVPGAVLMPWSGKVAAVLTNFMPGQQAGNSIADVLFGVVNPSGKLPITFPNAENETAFSPEQWPGLPVDNPIEVKYSEGLLVGYRYYDTKGIQFTTGFPFGHGLSYTDFQYSDLTIKNTRVTFTVKNVGKVAGSEVAQLYLGFPKAAGEPPLQLKGFKKTGKLDAGASEVVELEIEPRDLSIWDSSSHSWSPVKGTFDVKIGSSSRDLRLSGSMKQNEIAFV